MSTSPLAIDSHPVARYTDATLVARGLISEPFDSMTVTSGVAPTAGNIYLVLNQVRSGQVVTGAVVGVVVAGAGTPPTLIKLGLYTPALVASKLAETANVASDAQWTAAASTTVRFPFATPYTALSDLSLYACVVQVGSFGTTQVTLARGLTGILSVATKVLPGTGVRMSGTVTGQTDLPAVLSVADGTANFYIALY